MDMKKIDSLFNEPAHFHMSIPDLVDVLGASERRIRQLIQEMDLDVCPITSCPDLISRKGNLHIFHTRTPYSVFRTSIIRLACALLEERTKETQKEIGKRKSEMAAHRDHAKNSTVEGKRG